MSEQECGASVAISGGTSRLPRWRARSRRAVTTVRVPPRLRPVLRCTELLPRRDIGPTRPARPVIQPTDVRDGPHPHHAPGWQSVGVRHHTPSRFRHPRAPVLPCLLRRSDRHHDCPLTSPLGLGRQLVCRRVVAGSAVRQPPPEWPRAKPHHRATLHEALVAAFAIRRGRVATALSRIAPHQVAWGFWRRGRNPPRPCRHRPLSPSCRRSLVRRTPPAWHP